MNRPSNPGPRARALRTLTNLVLSTAALLACTAPSQAQITTLGTFNGTNGRLPYGGLTLSGGTLYGATLFGGASGTGTVFSVPVGGGSVTTLATLASTSNIYPSYPFADLTLIGSTLYGTTPDGGADGVGMVFSVPVGGGSVTTLASFNYANGNGPVGGLTLSGSTFYGTTAEGGANNAGAVFSVPVGGGTPTLLASFNGTNGAVPTCGLTLVGSTLYGTTGVDGANGDGTVFSVPVGGGSVTTLATFAGTSNGSDPGGSLTLIGSTFYGTTMGGGANNDGTVFSVPVGGGSVTTLATFAGTSNGAYPYGSLTLIGSTLYGTTTEGGANNDGTVFSVPVGGGSVTTLATFAGTSNGANPYGSLTLSGDGSTFYGTTSHGGANGFGTVFSVPTPEPSSAVLLALGAGALLGWRRRRSVQSRQPEDCTITKHPFATPTNGPSHPGPLACALHAVRTALLATDAAILLAVPTTSQAQITTLASFDGTNGNNANGSLTLSSDGTTLYGSTRYGGADTYGTVFSVPVSGGTPTPLATFAGADGSYPIGSLTLSGGTLYGVANFGGASYGSYGNNQNGYNTEGYGAVFSVPVGGGTPAVLASFNDTNGIGPSGSLTLIGSTLYGTTILGANGYGTAFSLPTGGGAPTPLASFNGSNGASYPAGRLTLSQDGSTFYFITHFNSNNAYDGVFSVPVGGGTPTLLASFTNFSTTLGVGAGATPYGGLTLSNDGKTLYGAARYNGANGDYGYVYSVAVGSGTVTPLASFNGTNGAQPQGTLTLIGGTLYGTASAGGADGDGDVFSVPAGGGTITDLADFNNTNGAAPDGGLTLSDDGSTFYGTTESGGANGDGTVFSVPVSAPEPASPVLLALSAGALLGWLRRRSPSASSGNSTLC